MAKTHHETRLNYSILTLHFLHISLTLSLSLWDMTIQCRCCFHMLFIASLLSKMTPIRLAHHAMLPKLLKQNKQNKRIKEKLSWLRVAGCWFFIVTTVGYDNYGHECILRELLILCIIFKRMDPTNFFHVIFLFLSFCDPFFFFFTSFPLLQCFFYK